MVPESLFLGHDNVLPLLRANYVPSATEKASFAEAVPKCEDRLATLEGEMLLLQARLDRLVCERQAIDDALQCGKSLLSPIRRVPAEVLAEIFLFSSSPTFLNDSDDGLFSLMPSKKLSRNAAPLVLLQICKYWRDVALQTPRLFTRFILKGAALNINPLEILSLCINSSRSLPLQIYLQPTTYWKLPDSAMSSFLKNIRSTIQRVTTFVFRFGSFLPVLFPPGTHVELPALRQLALIKDFDWRVISDLSPLTVIGNVVATRVVEALIELDFDWSKFIRFGDSLRYIKFNISGPTPNVALHAILIRSPNLEKCEITYRDTRPGENLLILAEHITLPHLTKFTLKYEGLRFLGDILRHLFTPKLEELSIFCKNRRHVPEDENLLPWIVEWMQNSRPNLHKFVIAAGELEFDTDHVHDLLELLPTLQIFESIQGIWSSDAICPFDRSFYPEICPILTELRFRQSRVRLSAIMDAVLSRAIRFEGAETLPLLQKLSLQYMRWCQEGGEGMSDALAVEVLRNFKARHPEIEFKGRSRGGVVI